MSWDTFNRVTGHATINAGINSTINGGSFGDAFKESLLANIQGEVGKSTAGWIGDNGDALGEAGKTIAHGVTSGAIAEITGGYVETFLTGVRATPDIFFARGIVNSQAKENPVKKVYDEWFDKFDKDYRAAHKRYSTPGMA